MNNEAPVPDCLVLYCRAGFEGECASEIQEHAAELGYSGYCKAKPDSGYVVFVPHESQHSAALASLIPFHALIFARQMFAANLINGLPVDDRITPLLDNLAGVAVCEVMVETADTNGKEHDRVPEFMKYEPLPPHNQVFDVPDSALDSVFKEL